MATVRLPVKNLLYSRVESAYSPRRRAGYQIVYQSAGIEKEAAEIEKRVQCFQAGDGAERLQFFATSTGNYVVTRTLPIETPDPVIIDSSRRPGPFVTQAYILDAAAFRKIGNDPFVLFEDSGLFDLVDEEAFTQRVPTLAVEPIPETISVNVERRTEQPDPDWRDEELAKLWNLALGAAEWTGRKQTLLFSGAQDSQVMTDMLRLLFQVLEPADRLACTFSTLIDECVPAPGTYWAAVAVGKRVSGAGFVGVRFDTYQVEASGIPDPKVTHYVRWLRDSWQRSRKLSDVVTKVPTAQIASESFALGNPLPTAEALDGQVIRELIQTNQEEMHPRLIEVLNATLTKPVAKSFMPVLERFLDVRDEFNAISTGSIPASAAAASVYQWLLGEKPDLKDWKAVEKVGKAGGHLGLQIIAHLFDARGWMGQMQDFVNKNRVSERKDLLEQLSHLPEADQKQLIRELRQAGAALDELVAPQTSRLIAEYMQSPQTRDEDLNDQSLMALLVALLENESELEAVSLAPLIARVSDKKALNALTKTLKKHPGTNALALAVSDRLATL